MRKLAIILVTTLALALTGASGASAYWSGLTEVQQHGAVDAWQNMAGDTETYTGTPEKAIAEGVQKAMERSFADTHEFSLAPETVESFVQTGFTPLQPVPSIDLAPTLADGLAPLEEELAPTLLAPGVGEAVGTLVLAGTVFGALYTTLEGLTAEAPVTEPLTLLRLEYCNSSSFGYAMSGYPCGGTVGYEARSVETANAQCIELLQSEYEPFYVIWPVPELLRGTGGDIRSSFFTGGHCFETKEELEGGHPTVEGQVPLLGGPYYVAMEDQVIPSLKSHPPEATPFWSSAWGLGEGCLEASVPAAPLVAQVAAPEYDSALECLGVIETIEGRRYEKLPAPATGAYVAPVENNANWQAGGLHTVKPGGERGLSTLSVHPPGGPAPSAAQVALGLKQVLDQEGNSHTEGENPLRKYVVEGISEGEPEPAGATMPDCLGIVYYECEEKLTAAGIEWTYAPESGTNYRNTFNYCTNFCIVAQSVLPGTEVPSFTPVEIEYAPEILTIPTPGELEELHEYIKELEEEGFSVEEETLTPGQWEEENETEKKRKRVVVTLPWPGKINELPWPGRGGTGSPREKSHREKIEREHGRPAQPKPGFSPSHSPQPGGEPGAEPGSEPNPNGELGDEPAGEPSVKVELNPETRPETPPFTGGGGGGPLSLDPPGIKKHIHLAVLCEKFPFGIPCWLIEELGDWSKSSSTPSLGWDHFTVCIKAQCGTIPATHVSLAPLEPVMEYLRPAMIIFATIGLLLLLYRFAMGGSPPSGSQSDASTAQPEDSA